MINKNNVVVKRNTFKHLAPSGRGRHEVPGEGVLNKEHFMGTPSSPLWGTSPARGEVNGGFTLIELLVVVLIIGILAAVAVPQYQKAVMKTRIVEYETNLKALARAAHACKLGTGNNCTESDLDIEMPAPTEIKGFLNNVEYRPITYGISDKYVYVNQYNGDGFIYYAQPWSVTKLVSVDPDKPWITANKMFTFQGFYCRSMYNNCSKVGFLQKASGSDELYVRE